MKAILLTPFLFSVVMFAQSTWHGIDADWYAPPLPAVTSALPELNGAVANNMVLKDDGTTIFFYRKGNSSPKNYWVGSTDHGLTWNAPPPSQVTTPGINAANGLSTVSADIDTANTIHIIWKSGPFAISYSQFNGTSWSTAVSIPTGGTGVNDTVGFSQVSVDRNGIIHVMWQQGNHNHLSLTSSCWYSRSVDGGSTFSAVPIELTGTLPGDGAFPVADFGGSGSDTLCIAWRQNLPGNPNMSVMDWDVYGSISYDNGNSWNSPFPIANGSDHQWDPNLVVDKKGYLHLFYHEYHNDTTGADKTANVHYTWSADGGATWGSDTVISDTVRSHLVKTAYDFVNDAVWCFWKDERDGIFGNPRADLMGVYVINTGTPVISSREFLCDHDTMEISYHNFKVGRDGIVRAVYNNSVAAGKGDTVYYTERTSLTGTAGMEIKPIASYFHVYPNPTNGCFAVVSDVGQIQLIQVIDIAGNVCYTTHSTEADISHLPSGIYQIKINTEGNVGHIRLVRQ